MDSQKHNNSSSWLAVAGLVSMFSLGACSPPSAKLLPKPAEVVNEIEKPEVVTDVGASVESFTPEVDILFVVDDSGSMANHQTNLSENINLFTKGIDGNKVIDYHIGVLTSSMGPQADTGDGRLYGDPRFVKRDTVGGLAALERSLMPGTQGWYEERFFDPVVKALTVPRVADPKTNLGFYRPGAHLAVIFITDTDDQSVRYSASSFYEFLLDLKKGSAEQVHTYAVIIPTGDLQCRRDTSETEPLIIERFMGLSDGLSFSLCDPLFGEKLAGIGRDLVKKVSREIKLTRLPDPKSIVVKYGTIVLPNDLYSGWVYDPVKNVLLLGESIDWSQMGDGARLEVTFQVAVAE